MRKSLTKFRYPVIGRATAISSNSSVPCSFSTSSSNGGGGRGRGGSNPFQFSVDQPQRDNSKLEDASPAPHGHGRGRDQPLPPPNVFSFPNLPPIGRGRGFIPSNYSASPEEEESKLASSVPKPNVTMPHLLAKDETKRNDSRQSEAPVREMKVHPSDIVNVLSGDGRGRPLNIPSQRPREERRIFSGDTANELSGAGRGKPQRVAEERPRAVNRHISQRPQPMPRPDNVNDEQKINQAMHILNKSGGPREGGREEFRGRERDGERGGMYMNSGRGRGGMDRGRGRGGRSGGRGRMDGGRGRGRYGDYKDDDGGEDDYGISMGDDADGDKIMQKIGPEVMAQLTEALGDDDGSEDEDEDDYLDALHTNFMIECEPEYLMEEFGMNPDLDEKPPIALRDAFEKMKPFLVAYEGIQTQEEWEEVIEETMKTVPLMKKIVDDYSGLDRVTAKQQQGELDRVAKTLPTSVPDSVKRFTEHAVLSLQSNPGWGWDKKCMYMDKLVMETSKLYK